MKTLKPYFVILFFALLSSCSQYVDQRDNSTSSGGTTTTPTQPVVPPGGSGSGGSTGGGTTSSTTSYIKFFNPVNFGSLTVSLNNANVGTIGQYASTASYYTGINGTNTIAITQNGITLLSIGVDLVGGSSYSCFFFKVGFDWKINVIKDDLTAPTSKFANIRILDFRTQAYYDLVRLNIYSLGLDQYVDSNRHFLDHSTYSFYTKFKSVAAGTYTAYVYNDTINLTNKRNIVFTDGKLYSILLVTDATLSSTQAYNKISLDIEQHN
jgi:hypothetical protein